MSVTLANVGGTQTGGSSVVLTYAGSPTPRKTVYYTPTHTRLAPREVDFFVEDAKTTDQNAGVARAGLRITLANRAESPTCCDVKSGSVIIDVGVRWSLNQPASLVDDALALLQSASYSQTLVDMIKNGVPPN